MLMSLRRRMMMTKTYKPIFSDNTWEQIIEACQTGKVPNTWVVGDQKPMIINGVSYLIDIIGKNHDVYSDGSGTAPLTFQSHEVYGVEYQMHSSKINSIGWSGCDMRQKHLPSVLGLMPSEVQNNIREVNKMSSAGWQSSSIVTTADKLFLLSEIEVFGTRTYSYEGEGTQYEYYKNGNSALKYDTNGYACHWKCRSPANDTLRFCIVYDTGIAEKTDATIANPPAFAFCF